MDSAELGNGGDTNAVLENQNDVETQRVIDALRARGINPNMLSSKDLAAAIAALSFDNRLFEENVTLGEITGSTNGFADALTLTDKEKQEALKKKQAANDSTFSSDLSLYAAAALGGAVNALSNAKRNLAIAHIEREKEAEEEQAYREKLRINNRVREAIIDQRALDAADGESSALGTALKGLVAVSALSMTGLLPSDPKKDAMESVSDVLDKVTGELATKDEKFIPPDLSQVALEKGGPSLAELMEYYATKGKPSKKT
jgi:hypothetical protein